MRLHPVYPRPHIYRISPYTIFLLVKDTTWNLRYALPMAGNSMNLLPKPSADKRTKSTEYEQKLIKEFSARTAAQ